MIKIAVVALGAALMLAACTPAELNTQVQLDLTSVSAKLKTGLADVKVVIGNVQQTAADLCPLVTSSDADFQAARGILPISDADVANEALAVKSANALCAATTKPTTASIVALVAAVQQIQASVIAAQAK